MSTVQGNILVLAIAAAPVLASGHEAESLASGHAVPIHASYTARAWADNEYLANRDADFDAARLCTKAKGQVVSRESLGTRMLGNGTWHATTRVTCLMNQPIT